jgi:prenylcysteine oxidase / farnesylcysteine lyase
LQFNSLNYIKKLGGQRREGEEMGAEEHLVKIFSSESMSDAKLEKIFGERTVGWIYRKEWDAYPCELRNAILLRRSSADALLCVPIDLKPTREFPPLVVDERLFYINALEPLVSTMETSTVSARNAVALLLQEWYGKDFIHGGKNCGRAPKEEYRREWAEWGCRSA